ncbi:hypothetical protein EGW08_017237, partial [Elysia chlorotica]
MWPKRRYPVYTHGCALAKTRRKLGLDPCQEEIDGVSYISGDSTAGLSQKNAQTPNTQRSTRDALKVLYGIFRYPFIILHISGFPVQFFKYETNDLESDDAEDTQMCHRANYLNSVLHKFVSLMFLVILSVHIMNIVRCLAFIVYAIKTFECSTALFYIHFTLFTLPGSIIFGAEVLYPPAVTMHLSRDLCRYNEKFGLFCNVASFQRRVNIWTCVTVSLYTLMIVVWAVFYRMVSETGNPFFTYPWLHSCDTWSELWTAVVCVSMLVTGWPLVAHYVLYTSLVALFAKEYGKLAKYMSVAWREMREAELEKAFTQLRERHTSLSRVMISLSAQCSRFCGLVILFDVVTFMFAVYAAARGPRFDDRIVSETMSAVFALVSISCVCGYWGKINSK